MLKENFLLIPSALGNFCVFIFFSGYYQLGFFSGLLIFFCILNLKNFVCSKGLLKKPYGNLLLQKIPTIITYRKRV